MTSTIPSTRPHWIWNRGTAEGVLWETGWASAHHVPETRGPTLFREFGSLLTVHALTQNNTLWHSWDHHNYEDEHWRDYFSMSKRKSPGVGPSWVWACLTIIILPKFLGRINRRICCICHLFPVGPSLLGKPHVGGIATHETASSSLVEERQCSGNSQRMEEWRRREATTYKLYVTRVWVLFSLKNISTFPNCLESIHCLTGSSPPLRTAHLCVRLTWHGWEQLGEARYSSHPHGQV